MITILDLSDASLDVVQGHVGDRVSEVVPIHFGGFNGVKMGKDSMNGKQEAQRHR